MHHVLAQVVLQVMAPWLSATATAKQSSMANGVTWRSRFTGALFVICVCIIATNLSRFCTRHLSDWMIDWSDCALSLLEFFLRTGLAR